MGETLTLDLTGLSIDAALAVATADMGTAVVEVLDRCENFLRDQGATDLEVGEFLKFKAAQLDEWRAKSLCELRGWLERDGESLN